jgi:hypothetical protein
MALSLIVDNLESVAETLRDEYESDGSGKFVLKAAKGYESPDAVKGLKSALQKERDNVGARSTELSKIKEQLGDLTPDQIVELRAKLATDEENKAKAAGEWDKLKGQMNDQHKAALAKKDEENGALRNALNAQLIDSEAARAIADEKGNATLLMPHVKAMTRVVEEGGKFKVVVVDEVGTPKVDAKGEPLTIKALVAQLRTNEVYAGAFAGSGNSGGGAGAGAGAGGGGAGAGGAGAGGGSGAGTKPTSRSKMTIVEKTTYIKEHGTDEYMKIPA